MFWDLNRASLAMSPNYLHGTLINSMEIILLGGLGLVLRPEHLTLNQGQLIIMWSKLAIGQKGEGNGAIVPILIGPVWIPGLELDSTFWTHLTLKYPNWRIRLGLDASNPP